MIETAYLNAQLIADAADASTDVYIPSLAKSFEYWRKVEQFHPIGELAAGMRLSVDKKTAFIAIRGTSLIGNWLFTNFQAYFTSFNIVDNTLSAAPSTSYQGGSYRTPIHGSLHQGFYRAFSWLWYGTEPVLGHALPTRSVGISRFKRYVTLFFLLPLIIWLSLQMLVVLLLANSASSVGTSWASLSLKTLVASLAATLVITFIFVTFESGVWEDIFRTFPKTSGDVPFKLASTLNQYDKVVFTGHSLGGAVATIAFSVYRCWCRSDSSRKDNGRLVTFGAPRVGDVPFMEEFVRMHRGRFLHVVHPRDPVPELPPNGFNELRLRKIWSRGSLGILILFLFPLWSIIAKLYRANRAARWSDDTVSVITPDGSNKLSFKYHNMATVYQSWARLNNIFSTDA